MRHATVLASLLWILPATAEPLPGAIPDTMTVTAHRTPREIARTGTALSVVDREQIGSRQHLVAAEALRAVPGLAIARSGPFGAQTQLRLRGSEANHVLVLIDGVEANDPATADEFSFEHLTTFDVERIEVVRGPQSALWGSDALAGVINVVTRMPREPLEAGGSIESGADGMVNAAGSLGLRSGRGAVRFGASSVETDGTNASREGSEDDGYDSSTIAVRGTFDPAPGIGLSLGARHTDSTTQFDDSSGGLPVDADNRTDAEQSYLQAGVRSELLEGRWTHDLRYAITQTDTDTRSENLFTPGLDYDDVSAEGDKYGVYYQTSLRVTPGREAAPGNLLTLAVDHEREEYSQRGFGGFADQDQDLHSTGLAAEYLHYVGADLSLSASVRHDDNSDFDDATTWRATASQVFPAHAARLHASYGTGQKSPTFVERFGFFPGSFVGNPDLEPETSTGWDVGVEKRWLDGRLTTDLTYFRADLEDEIDGFVRVNPDDPFDFTATAANLHGTSHRKGVEAALQAALGSRYTLGASYTYTDATQPGEAGQQREVRRPLHTGSVDLQGRWLADRLTIHLGAAYTGDRKDDFFGPPAFSGERVDLDDYTLVRLAAAWQLTPAVAIHGRIENALDEDYEDVYGFNTPGASAYAGVRVNLRR